MKQELDNAHLEAVLCLFEIIDQYFMGQELQANRKPVYKILDLVCP